MSVKADPTTWTVDDYGPADFNTIQEAISNANSGDTIFVKAGIYYERVVVDKSLFLVGENRDLTIVDGNRTGTVISIILANNVSIEGFTIRGGGVRSGILVDHSSGNDISHNKITDNTCGIALYSSSDNVFLGNTISSNVYYGISLNYYSSNNVFSGNTITDNYYGMYFVLYSKNNIFYCNNFNNKRQVKSDSKNFWDNGCEGNYWSDYKGADFFSGPYRNETGSDGIGDTPYYIDENNRDNYPLMGMFSDFNVTLERETYHVTTICNATISEFRFQSGTETGNKMIRFNVTGKDGTFGFCRIMIPTGLMNYPYIVLVDVEEIVPTLLDVSNETNVYLYFTYVHSSHTITIISSKTLQLYNELLDKYIKLQIDLYNLNATYYDLLNNYNILLGNYSQLQRSYHELSSFYYDLLNSYSILLGNYSQLQEDYRELNNSYEEHLLDYSRNVDNIRNLMYIFAAITAAFIITTIYLSKHAHVGKTKALLPA